MRRLHRHRRQRKKSYIPLIAVVLAAAAVLWLLWTFITSFSFGSTVQTSFTTSSATPEQISVRIGEDWNQNVTDIKLYEKNELRTNNGFATMYSAVGEEILLDHNTDVRIVEAITGDDASAWEIALTTGAMFVKTKPQTVPTTRIVALDDFSVRIPDSVQVFITSNGVHVLSDETAGLELLFTTLEEPIIVGEGQSFVLDTDASTTTVETLYALRTPLKRDLLSSRLIEQVSAQISDSSTLPTSTTLAINEPLDNAEITTSTVVVSGTVSSDVVSLEMNAAEITLNDANEFNAELSVPLGTFTIETSAKNIEGETVANDIRTITRLEPTTLEPLVLTIAEPVPAGQTFTTSSDTVIIRGTVSSNTASIRVNDYTLQLYEAGETTWQYIAQTALNNFAQGSNTYRIQATAADGSVSSEQVITIVKNSDTVSSSQSTQSQSSVVTTTNESASIIRTGPTANDEYQTSTDNIVIEGTITGKATSVWVNGYQLQLFNPERGIWNYLANTDLNTLSAGTNQYRIEARDSAGNLLDSDNLTIIYTPSGE